MTAASAARRERRLRSKTEGAVTLDKPPLLIDLRPMTIDDLEPGETWVPGMTILAARRCDEQGNPLPPSNVRVMLPPELRANTFENVAEIFRRFRRVSQTMKDYVDGFTLFFPKAEWVTEPPDPTVVYRIPG